MHAVVVRAVLNHRIAGIYTDASFVKHKPSINTVIQTSLISVWCDNVLQTRLLTSFCRAFCEVLAVSKTISSILVTKLGWAFILAILCFRFRILNSEHRTRILAVRNATNNLNVWIAITICHTIVFAICYTDKRTWWRALCSTFFSEDEIGTICLALTAYIIVWTFFQAAQLSLV